MVGSSGSTGITLSHTPATMSNSLLEHLSAINDLVEDVIRENVELKKKVDQMTGVFGQKMFGNTNRKKLTPRDVAGIRSLKRSQGLSNKELADIYDINPATVSRIVLGQYHK